MPAGEAMLLPGPVPHGDYAPCISLMKGWETSIRCQLTQALTLRGSTTCGTYHQPFLGRGEDWRSQGPNRTHAVSRKPQTCKGL